MSADDRIVGSARLVIVLVHIRELADRVLAPVAEDVDRSSQVPLGHLRSLADAGLWGLVGPAGFGGSSVDPADRRRVMAAVAGGCGATFFVWAQHHGVVLAFTRAMELANASGKGTKAESHDGDRLGGMDHDRIRSTLRSLCAGDIIAGTTFAFLRNRHAPGVRAERLDGGWRLSGMAPWLTSWGIANHFLFASTTDTGRIVWSVVVAGPDDPVPGLVPCQLDLAVFGATGSISLQFDNVIVDDADVLFTEPLDMWRVADRIRSAPGQPAPLGLAERCATELSAFDDDESRSAVEAILSALDASWNEDDRIIAEIPAVTAATFASAGADDEFVATAIRHRARCLTLAHTASTALLAAWGGRGMGRNHSAQRLVREAAFWVIQGQTSDGRRGALDQVRRTTGGLMHRKD